MNAAQIWATQGGLIESNERWLLVNLHEITKKGMMANKPIKNIRFAFQVMMNDADQSLPVQFRSVKQAREFLHGRMENSTFQQLIENNQARMFYGRGK
jgi:hypothetical protein